ncbi:MAG: iron ABC transporter permease [Acetobacteraceae bacterium]|nr:iron ABC transporter permease [Acetobacteraceae bacterium]MDW8397053.1 iron ABC transporter permease [Acetobacteraceae bacterium]
MRPTAAGGGAAALSAALLLLPWHRPAGSGWWFLPDPAASAAASLLAGGPPFLPFGLAALALLAVPLLPRSPRRGALLVGLSALAGALLLLQGYAVTHRGLGAAWLAPLFGDAAPQPGLGAGGWLALGALFVLAGAGLAERGGFRGDGFLAASVLLLAGLLVVFVFLPLALMFAEAFRAADGSFAPGRFLALAGGEDVWGLGCLGSGRSCGVVWNTLLLGVLTAGLSTLLGLAFALLYLRSSLPGKRVLRILSILPIITPPFVVSLAVIVLFGRTGIVSVFLDEWFDIPRSRWIYGLWGVLIAQVLSQAPLAFLVLVGVLEGISPTLEEASGTLGARRWDTFARVTWPLLKPGLAAAFLVNFVESLSDFGNPLVLGGNFEVLSVRIYFAVVGAQHDPARAAALGIVLLALTLGAFLLQRRWLGRASYVTVTGKGDAGLPAPLPRRVDWACRAVALPWAAFTVVTYGIVVFGGFVADIGRFDLTFSWRHFERGFGITWDGGPFFHGSAWPSLFTTLWIAAVAAPLTAAVGLLAAWLTARQRFPGRATLEFGTLLSFAVPGTVVGVSYIVAFNVPPFELTGTGMILVFCFVFRNMPVGMRAGLAGLAQIDRSLDEASASLGAGSATTLRRVVLPLLRPAIVTGLVYSFVSAITAVSAVIFLVSAEHNLATAYIAGRVEAGEYPLAIAYATVLIGLMLAGILAIQALVGERRLGRRIAAGGAR